jgi:hypothetical protein
VGSLEDSPNGHFHCLGEAWIGWETLLKALALTLLGKVEIYSQPRRLDHGHASVPKIALVSIHSLQGLALVRER